VQAAAKNLVAEEGDMNYELFKKRFDFLIEGIVKKDEHEEFDDEQQRLENDYMLRSGT